MKAFAAPLHQARNDDSQLEGGLDVFPIPLVKLLRLAHHLHRNQHTCRCYVIPYLNDDSVYFQSSREILEYTRIFAILTAVPLSGTMRQYSPNWLDLTFPPQEVVNSNDERKKNTNNRCMNRTLTAQDDRDSRLRSI